MKYVARGPEVWVNGELTYDLLSEAEASIIAWALNEVAKGNHLVAGEFSANGRFVVDSDYLGPTTGVSPDA